MQSELGCSWMLGDAPLIQRCEPGEIWRSVGYLVRKYLRPSHRLGLISLRATFSTPSFISIHFILLILSFPSLNPSILSIHHAPVINTYQSITLAEVIGLH